MGDAPNPQRSEMWVTHPPCQQTWIAAYLPMELSKAARLLKNTTCPRCGERKDIFMAKEADIVKTLAERNTTA